ncbi:MAG TPA: LysE family transporter [Actinomycetota bacterium]|nr:LysE family transporter [Actinomycetota bacterium]
MFFRGLVIGLSIAAPVGPIGILCIRRTLRDGRLAGFVSGLGAATADGLYGAVAAFGLSAISDALVRYQTPLRVVGGAFLLGLGARILITSGRQLVQSPDAKRKSLLSAYGTTFALTVSNPLTILSFAALFAGLGLVTRDSGGASVVALGVFLGSALWWLILSFIAGLLRRRAITRAMTWINRTSGTVIVGFGVLALLSAA